MVKLKIRSNDKEVEFEGEKAEILDIYHEIMKTTTTGHVVKHAKRPLKVTTEREFPGIKFPSDSDLIQYILSRPEYSHDTIEIQKHFFGRRITSRANPKEYRRLGIQLKRVRKKIEEEKQGEFEALTGKAKNLKRYVFRPISSLEKVFG